MRVVKAISICWIIAGILGFFVDLTIPRATAQSNPETVVVPSNPNEYPTTRFWLANGSLPVKNAWEAPAPELINAVILDIDERDIVCISKGKTEPSKLPSAQLQAIDVVWGTEAAAAAHAAFLSEDFSTAINLAKTAIAEGKIPRWQQKILASEITDSLVRLGQISNACRVFISLCKESPAPMLYVSAPLNWTSERGNTQLIQQAQEWIKPERAPIEQLIGASWLLNSGEAQSAQAILEQLSRSRKSPVTQLATAQLWRSVLPNQVAEQYAEWSAIRDRMLMPLQLGPTRTIADRLERTGKKDLGLQEWLRIVSLYPKHRVEFQQARDAAAELLKQLGRPEEAHLLLMNKP